MRQQVDRRCFLGRFPTAPLIGAVLCLQHPSLYPYQGVCQLHWLLNLWHTGVGTLSLVCWDSFLGTCSSTRSVLVKFQWLVVDKLFFYGVPVKWYNAAFSECCRYYNWLHCILMYSFEDSWESPFGNPSISPVILSWFIVLLISDRIFSKTPTSHGCNTCVNLDGRHSKMMLFCMAVSIRSGLTCAVAPSTILDEQKWSKRRNVWDENLHKPRSKHFLCYKFTVLYNSRRLGMPLLSMIWHQDDPQT